ncbi:heme o synthase [Agilicoccus flavus]|uniref:heme o synthase n=1 Tax=Agilicoccus flavus TaxID=2775968 RepID=UPI001CF61A01|nr:heme o synthase [Agilicoccus flavus]
MTALHPRRTSAPELDASARSATLADYVSLTKPRIIELLLVTTFPVMFLAQRGVPPVGLILATLVGGTLSAASANTLNCYLDRDIDRLMHRTENRPLATGVISPGRALAFGIVLGVASVLLLGFAVNWLSAGLSLGAIFLYVVFYTMVLKRRTSQNIVWGGIAGCFPVLIGWSAVTNRLDWAAVVLFLVVFLWTPPHYWPLSMRFKDDYAAAGVPMLPVVAQDVTVARQVVAYAWATVVVSLALVPVADMGWIYLVAALVSGAVFLLEAHRLLRRACAPENTTLASLRPMRLFHYSISYLTLLFVAVALDPLLHLPLPF